MIEKLLDTQKNNRRSDRMKNKLFDSHNKSNNFTDIEEKRWKPPLHSSYETMALTNKGPEGKARPIGFKANGKIRNIREDCLLAKIKTRNRVRSKNPKMAVCITMYNEKEDELKDTLTGVIYNYNELRNDTELNFKKDDLVVFLICDGYDSIPDSFKKYAKEKEFFN